MGVDLLPRNKSISSFHSNWTGWRYIANVLDQAGVDITKMPFSNDGHYVNARTARHWGNAILAAIPNLYEERIPNSIYEGGYYYRPLILELDKAEELAMMLKEGNIMRPRKTAIDFLKRFADFCINSRGFWVY